MELLNLQMFADMNVNTTNDNTPGNDLSPGMKTYYKTSLLENARQVNYLMETR